MNIRVNTDVRDKVQPFHTDCQHAATAMIDQNIDSTSDCACSLPACRHAATTPCKKSQAKGSEPAVQDGNTLMHVCAACQDSDPFKMDDYLDIAGELIHHGFSLVDRDRVCCSYNEEI